MSDSNGFSQGQCLKGYYIQSTVQEFLTTIHDNILDDVHEELHIINLYNLTNMNINLRIINLYNLTNLNINLNYIYRTLIISSATP